MYYISLLELNKQYVDTFLNISNLHLSLFEKTGRWEMKTIYVSINKFIKINI